MIIWKTEKGDIKWVLWKNDVRRVGEWNVVKIVSTGGLWYVVVLNLQVLIPHS
jgi:hypothetical protein